ncbi:RagB/SusD family nutrient uptake outer membrane protein [Chitinophaga caseinilytica]|uniref:RagB/SusD family nutrient uptake outer membrane protein n=1 Tax=Chitinophaga caseinilytica TaxID=2267521 RepID=A0ABZ2Z046_9BACT
MKKINFYICFGMVTVAAVSCKKNFLDRFPKTEVTKEVFFNNPQDLETYSNGFYGMQPVPYQDIESDNTSNYQAAGYVDGLVRGTVTPVTVGGWNNWGDLRRINFMLVNAGKAQGDAAAIRHFIGIAKYFRAMFYFSKLRDYSDVPWYGKPLATDDPDLYKGRDSRALIADSILADLNYAVENIKPDEGNRTRVTKWAALALLSRFGLYEGTFRKYHPEVNLTNEGKKFLERSVWASEQIMGSNRFTINNTGKGGEDYRALFCSATLNGVKEIIMWADYQQALGASNNTHTVLGYQWALSNSLAETYLMKDGTPFTAQPGYATKTLLEVLANRDPRMNETIASPGFSPNLDNKPYVIKPTIGGYDQVKFYPRLPSQRQGWDANYTALPIYRYAEVLLNLAEAKAELGTITATDLNNTVNLLRARVQMPAMTLTPAADPVLAAQYPGVASTLLLELRRERRVELACEGLRFSDLMRWKAGARLQDAQGGMYVPALGAMDVTGDGNPDIAILASPNDESPIAGLPEDVKKNLTKFHLKDAAGKDNNFYLSGGTKGRIMFTVDRDQPRTFVEPKYYYRPIPQTQTVLNPALKQIFGW